jgi:hypothetical protein
MNGEEASAAPHHHFLLKVLELRLGGQLAVEQQIGDLEIAALFGQLFDGIAPARGRGRDEP